MSQLTDALTFDAIADFTERCIAIIAAKLNIEPNEIDFSQVEIHRGYGVCLGTLLTRIDNHGAITELVARVHNPQHESDFTLCYHWVD